MGIFSRTGRAAKWATKPAVDFPSWMGFKQIAGLSAGIIGNLKQAFGVKKEADHAETFDQAVARLQLTEEAIAAQGKNFLRLTLIFALIGLAILGYAIFLLWDGLIAGGCLAIILAVLSFANGFRYHFWYFQVKHCKLGCTVREWWDTKVED